MPRNIAAPIHEYEDRINVLGRTTARSLEVVDGWPSGLRACVHEYGYAIVHALKEAGITKPSMIRSLVHTIWMGARQPAQRRKMAGAGSSVLNHLDWILINAEAKISAATLTRILASHNMVIVPIDPSSVMVEASLDAVKTMGTVGRYEKHRRRLIAAIRASNLRLWPHLYDKDGKQL